MSLSIAGPGSSSSLTGRDRSCIAVDWIPPDQSYPTLVREPGLPTNHSEHIVRWRSLLHTLEQADWVQVQRAACGDRLGGELVPTHPVTSNPRLGTEATGYRDNMITLFLSLHLVSRRWSDVGSIECKVRAAGTATL